MALLDSIIGAESGGNPVAQNPNSSARGLGQFIDSTWLATIAKHRPDLAQGKSPAEVLALRDNPEISKEMTAAYAADNADFLTKNGIEPNAGATYLAHFAGPQGAVKVLSADPAAPVSAILDPAAVRANPFLANMTAGDLASWASRKMGSAGPVPPTVAGAHPVGAAAIPPAAAPMLTQQQAPMAAPPSAPPSFPSGGNAQNLYALLQPPPALAPAFAPPRRPSIDLNQLRQVFQQPAHPAGFLIG